MTVIAGVSHGVAGAVTRDDTAPVYLDIHLPARAGFAQALPAGHNAFVHVYEGSVQIGDTMVPAQRMAILDNAAGADGVRLQAAENARLLLIAGRPLGEPIVQYGPFVMNSQEQVYQALRDFRDGKLA